MAVGVFVYPEEMTSDQYAEVLSRLEQAGAGAPKGRRHHFCFGPETSLMVVDVWDTQEDFAAFAGILGPILADLNIEAEPGTLPLHNSISA